jgi:hypothetical protein
VRRVDRTILRCSRARLSALLAGVLGALSLALSAPAHAVVTEVGATKVGLQPHNGTSLLNGQLGSSYDNPGGNPVLHSTSTYTIYWDPTDRYHGDWHQVINHFLHDTDAVSGSLASVFAVDAQYTDSTNKPASDQMVFKGSYTDTDKYPAAGCKDPEPLEPEDEITCLSDGQVREELEKFIAQHGLQKGMGAIFYLLTPPGVTLCVDSGPSASHCSSNAASANSFCSYHAAITPTNPSTGDANTILYAAIPWVAGGMGDGQLALADRKPAYDCQDGGFDPSSKPIEEREKPKETTETKAEFEEKTKEEQEEQLERQAAEGPHIQEPNQLPCPTVDGFCDTGLADVIVGQIAAEQQNMVTNPLLNAWQDGARRENTDECRNFFARVIGGSVSAAEETLAGTLYNQSFDGGKYYLNTAFSLAALRLPYPAVPCLTGVRLVPAFTTPSPVNAGELVAFDGMESTVDLNAAISFSASVAEQPNYATYTWDFGDGSPTVSGYAPGASSANSPNAAPCEAPWLAPCAASTFHAYQNPGVYDVTLTVTDVAGNTASTTNPVTVVGPEPPPAEPGGGSSAGGSSTSTTATGGAAALGGGAAGPGSVAGAGAGTAAAPSATAVIVSRSLRTALRRGLAVRYAVNEKVAGRFEVLLAKSAAKKIGLRAPVVTGLARGTPAQTLIARSILVTTAGGRGQVRIHFSNANIARLRKLRGATLMLRLIVRNPSNATTTALAKSKLGA